jgi:hypothetical protein
MNGVPAGEADDSSAAEKQNSDPAPVSGTDTEKE